jgi:long-chain acyl-CoA synthetase
MDYVPLLSPNMAMRNDNAFPILFACPMAACHRYLCVKNLYAFFKIHAEEHGNRLAMVYRPRYRTVTWSYRELAKRTDRIACALAEKGIGPGDRVLLYGHNSPCWVAAYFAILARGAVVVPLNPKSPPAQLDRIVASAEPKLLLLSDRLAWPAAPVSSLCVERVAEDGRDGGNSGSPGLETETNSLAEIVYTSGTTGDPKGVVLTHGNLLSNVEAVAKSTPLEATDHIITLVPLFHMYGQMTSMLFPLRQGCAVTFLSSPSSRVITEALRHTPVTYLVAVPEFLKTVMDRLETRLAHVPSVARRLLRGRIRARISRTLHTIACGGAPLDPEIERKWRELGFEILQGYGLTETSPIVTSNTRTHHRLGSVGKPLEGVEVKIAPDGEILVRGPNVMVGYYRNERHTEKVFEGVWFKTDDAGRLDEEGFVYVLGRKRYMILGPGGENVYPEDLETELNKMPGVKDSAVVGVEEGGRAIIHAVLLGERCDGRAVVAEANRHLAPHQQIMAWSLWPEADFPRSATRKVRKEEVIHWLQSQQTDKPAAQGIVTPLIRLIAEVTRQDPRLISGSAKVMDDLKLDSLLRIELISRIEEELNIPIQESQITTQTTVGDLEALIKRQRGRPPLLAKYPRWSLSPWACALRRPIQRAMYFSWISRLCPLRVVGGEDLKDLQGPVIFMANHRSFLDSPLVALALPEVVRQRLAIAAGTETLYRTFWWFRPLAELSFNTYPFPTRAQENIRLGLDYTGRLLDDGWNILIFPEGQMNRSGQPIQPLKGGTGVLAVEMQVPIVPVIILGTEKVLPPDYALPLGRGAVEIRFGRPIRVSGESGYIEATRQMETAFQTLLNEQGSHELKT